MTNPSSEIDQVASKEIFDDFSRNFSVECIRNSANPKRLTLHSFDGKRYQTSQTIRRHGRTYAAPR